MSEQQRTAIIFRSTLAVIRRPWCWLNGWLNGRDGGHLWLGDYAIANAPCRHFTCWYCGARREVALCP